MLQMLEDHDREMPFKSSLLLFICLLWSNITIVMRKKGRRGDGQKVKYEERFIN